MNRWLERYKERSGYGLSKRKVFFNGDDEMIRDVRNDLLLSDLINHKNFTDPNIDLHDADIAILCISKTDKKAKEEDPNKPSGPKDDTPEDNDRQKEDEDWRKKARETVQMFTDQLSHRQALIVFTNGWLGDQTKNDIEKRSFSTLVNCRGRVVSDIHSLLTTLPPRNNR